MEIPSYLHKELQKTELAATTLLEVVADAATADTPPNIYQLLQHGTSTDITSNEIAKAQTPDEEIAELRQQLLAEQSTNLKLAREAASLRKDEKLDKPKKRVSAANAKISKQAAHLRIMKDLESLKPYNQLPVIGPNIAYERDHAQALASLGTLKHGSGSPDASSSPRRSRRLSSQKLEQKEGGEGGPSSSDEDPIISVGQRSRMKRYSFTSDPGSLGQRPTLRKQGYFLFNEDTTARDFASKLKKELADTRSLHEAQRRVDKHRIRLLQAEMNDLFEEAISAFGDDPSDRSSNLKRSLPEAGNSSISDTKRARIQMDTGHSIADVGSLIPRQEDEGGPSLVSGTSPLPTINEAPEGWIETYDPEGRSPKDGFRTFQLLSSNIQER